MKNSISRDKLLEDFFGEVSRMSTWTVMFHGAAATRLGLNPTDLKCGRVLQETGPITAGELAVLTGLTTGAITGVVDRLEREGFVRRARDASDRRRVIIEPLENSARVGELVQLFGPLAETTGVLLAQYSDEELATIVDFVSQGADMMRAETARLRDSTFSPKV